MDCPTLPGSTSPTNITVYSTTLSGGITNLVSNKPFELELLTDPVYLLHLQVLVEPATLPHLGQVEEHHPSVYSLQVSRRSYLSTGVLSPALSMIMQATMYNTQLLDEQRKREKGTEN